MAVGGTKAAVVAVLTVAAAAAAGVAVPRITLSGVYKYTAGTPPTDW